MSLVARSLSFHLRDDASGHPGLHGEAERVSGLREAAADGRGVEGGGRGGRQTHRGPTRRPRLRHPLDGRQRTAVGRVGARQFDEDRVDFVRPGGPPLPALGGPPLPALGGPPLLALGGAPLPVVRPVRRHVARAARRGRHVCGGRQVVEAGRHGAAAHADEWDGEHAADRGARLPRQRALTAAAGQQRLRAVQEPAVAARLAARRVVVAAARVVVDPAAVAPPLPPGCALLAVHAVGDAVQHGTVLRLADAAPGHGLPQTRVRVVVTRLALTGQLTSRLQLGQVLLPPLGRQVDLEVENTQQRDGHVEGSGGSDDRQVGVGEEELDVALAFGDRPPSLDVRPRDDPRRPEQCRDEPRSSDHQDGSPVGAVRPVRQRTRHRQVPVDADHQQVGDARVAHRVVEREPRVAHERPERPPVEDDIDGVERHRDDPDGEVGDRQTEQEVVTDRLQLAVHLEGDDDEQVAAGREDDEEEDDARDDDRLPRGEGLGNGGRVAAGGRHLASGAPPLARRRHVHHAVVEGGGVG